MFDSIKDLITSTSNDLQPLIAKAVVAFAFVFIIGPAYKTYKHLSDKNYKEAVGWLIAIVAIVAVAAIIMVFVVGMGKSIGDDINQRANGFDFTTLVLLGLATISYSKLMNKNLKRSNWVE